MYANDYIYQRYHPVIIMIMAISRYNRCFRFLANIKQLFDIKLSDIAIYSVEVNDIRRGAAELDIISPRPN